MKIKVIKGIILIIIGIMFLFVTFYNVVESLNILGRDVTLFSFTYAYGYYDGTGKTLYDFIQPTIINYLFAILFMGLGVLEIIDSGILKKAGDGNAY